jgi:hypothetical protein
MKTYEKTSESVSWDYYDKFDGVYERYLPAMGEGETMATQVVTAVCKLVYKWYNDGDVYDNTHYMEGWCTDLSSYANWLYQYAHAYSLTAIDSAKSDADYEHILKGLADWFLDETMLDELDKLEKAGSIYDCDGPFAFVLADDEDDYDEDLY